MARRYENQTLPPIRRRPSRQTRKENRTAKRRAAVLELWNSTEMTYREIAEELSIPPTTVTTDLWMLRKQGYEVKPGNTRRPKTVKPPAHKMEALMEVAETRRQYALRRRKEGALLTEIADELGVHHISVSRYLRTLRERESQTAEPRS